MLRMKIRNVLPLCPEATVGLHLLCSCAMCCSAAARGLLSAASAWVSLPAPTSQLRVSTSTCCLSVLATRPGLLLPAAGLQGLLTLSHAPTALLPLRQPGLYPGPCQIPEGGDLSHAVFSLPYRECGFVRCLCALGVGT